MPICDATGTEFLPDSCIPSPTSSSIENESHDGDSSSVSTEPASNRMRLHVMPAPTNILIKRNEDLGMLLGDFIESASLDASSNDEFSLQSASAEISSSHEDDSLLSEENDLAWSGIDNDGLGSLFAGILQNTDAKESHGNTFSASDNDKDRSEVEDPLFASNENSSSDNYPSSSLLWDIGTATSTEVLSSASTVASSTESHLENSIISVELKSNTSSEPLSSSNDDSSNISSSEISGESTISQVSDSHETASTLEPSSIVIPQSTLISVIEETNAAPFQDPSSSNKPMNVIMDGGKEECMVGSFRCTDDKRGFDTCVYGRWGTVRMCSQGTLCIPVEGGTIACA
ncbi:hypothetical protein IWW36_005051 [Coemansia brasiliensis]|uniref:Uncharacterized protein n=1 Tax=Coemansia brasiliensis TaxID=2650707 RepID=A0A9W8I2F5_9FUNG|nr:hypothetical protein IWW36_005051 [Coemansia brasiliensis]